MKNLRIDCNNYGNGIMITELQRKLFSNLEITQCPKKCISILKGYEVFIQNSYLRGSAYDTDSYGLYVKTADCHFSDIVIVNCKIAVRNESTNFFTRIHAWIWPPEILPNSVAFDMAAPTFLNQCYSDTYYISFRIKGDPTISINQCVTYFNKEFYNGTTMPNDKPYLFYYVDDISSYYDVATKVTGSLLQGCVNCYSDGSYGNFSNLPSIALNKVSKENVVKYWNNVPYYREESSVILKDGWTADTLNKLTTDGDRIKFEGCFKYNGTLKANINYDLCDLPERYHNANIKSTMCGVGNGMKWQIHDVGYLYLNHQTCVIKLNKDYTNPYIHIDCDYKLWKH